HEDDHANALRQARDQRAEPIDPGKWWLSGCLAGVHRWPGGQGFEWRTRAADIVGVANRIGRLWESKGDLQTPHRAVDRLRADDIGEVVSIAAVEPGWKRVSQRQIGIV